jgi:ATP-binding cassette subfamily B protein
VHLWNRSFIDNLCYGSPDAAVGHVGAAIDAADLVRVLQTMPDGLQTPPVNGVLVEQSGRTAS